MVSLPSAAKSFFAQVPGFPVYDQSRRVNLGGIGRGVFGHGCRLVVAEGVCDDQYRQQSNIDGRINREEIHFERPTTINFRRTSSHQVSIKSDQTCGALPMAINAAEHLFLPEQASHICHVYTTRSSSQVCPAPSPNYHLNMKWETESKNAPRR